MAAVTDAEIGSHRLTPCARFANRRGGAAAGSSPVRRCVMRVAIPIALQLTLLFLASATLPAQSSSHSSTPVPSRADTTVHGGTIFGSVKQGTIPLSGVLIIVRDENTKNKFTTITDGAGTYSVRVAVDGRYSIRFVFRALRAVCHQCVCALRKGRNRLVSIAEPCDIAT